MKKRSETLNVHALANTGLSRTYVIEGRDSLMAVDVGSIGSAKDVEDYIHNCLGRNLDDLRFVTATHFHIDHIGGMGYLIKRCPQTTQALFHNRVRDYLSGREKISLIKNWFSGFMPASIASTRYIRRISHLAFMNLAGIPLPGFRNIVNLPCVKEKITYFGVNGLRRYKLGFEQWDVIETPGHTEDSVSFFHDKTRELICGDLVVNIPKEGHGTLNRFHWRGDVIKESFQYLHDSINPVVIYPGHGDIIRNEDNALMGVETF
ncbi:MAG: MBL fold metallo-hydrolase [Deltaproteobacteria bacterium]|nr:MBL fold metallo-hydrolase [Deltaproteobacteria bacterium]